MELREIRTFLQIAQKQSFSKAAEALGYSQAAVTVQIKQLEEELGIHLFDRLGKKTVLTHHGEIFYRYAVTILGTVADAKNAVSASTELSGVLTIGTIESICESIFPDLLKEFHKRYPNVSVSIVLDSPDVLLDRMNKNSIDLVYGSAGKYLLRLFLCPPTGKKWSHRPCLGHRPPIPPDRKKCQLPVRS